MAKLQRFEDLDVWRLARRTARRIYEITDRPTFAKDISIRTQMRRAAGSTMSNIAEGFERQTSALRK